MTINSQTYTHLTKRRVSKLAQIKSTFNHDKTKMIKFYLIQEYSLL
jgi:hypothetical protein